MTMTAITYEQKVAAFTAKRGITPSQLIDDVIENILNDTYYINCHIKGHDNPYNLSPKELYKELYLKTELDIQAKVEQHIDFEEACEKRQELSCRLDRVARERGLKPWELWDLKRTITKDIPTSDYNTALANYLDRLGNSTANDTESLSLDQPREVKPNKREVKPNKNVFTAFQALILNRG